MRVPYRMPQQSRRVGLGAGAAAQQRLSRAPVRVVIEIRRGASARPLTIACVAWERSPKITRFKKLSRKIKISQIQGLEQKDSAERFR
jgi:hypothetical protein